MTLNNVLFLIMVLVPRENANTIHFKTCRIANRIAPSMSWSWSSTTEFTAKRVHYGTGKRRRIANQIAPSTSWSLSNITQNPSTMELGNAVESWSNITEFTAKRVHNGTGKRRRIANDVLALWSNVKSRTNVFFIEVTFSLQTIQFTKYF